MTDDPWADLPAGLADPPRPRTQAEMREDKGICPECSGQCHREEADVGVGIIYGPWGCPQCGWSEDAIYDQTSGPTYSETGYRTDQYGWLYPTQRREADHA